MLKIALTIISYITFFPMAFALSCPPPAQITFEGKNWQVPADWHITKIHGKKVVEFHYAMWTPTIKTALEPTAAPTGTLTCNYYTANGKNSYLVLSHATKQSPPDNKFWSPHYSKGYHFGLHHYSCFAEKANECAL